MGIAEYKSNRLGGPHALGIEEDTQTVNATSDALAKNIVVFEESFEQAGIRVASTGCTTDDEGFLNVFCELHTVDGGPIATRREIVARAYSADGFIRSSSKITLLENRFPGYASLIFELPASGIANEVKELRLLAQSAYYPKDAIYL